MPVPLIASDWRYTVISRRNGDKITPKLGRDVRVKHLLTRDLNGALTNTAKCGLGVQTPVKWSYDTSLLNALPRCRRCVKAGKIMGE